MYKIISSSGAVSSLDTLTKYSKAEKLQFMKSLQQLQAFKGITVSLIHSLLNLWRVNLNDFDKDRRTPVFKAAVNGDISTIRSLAKLGANVNTPDKDGRTPIWIAAANGHFGTIRELVTFEGNVNTPDKDGRTPLWIAACKGRDYTIRVLYNLRGNVNTPDKDGRTPVWIAACKGRVKTIRVLYNLRGNVNTPDKDGRTPVWIAACKGRVKTIRELDTLRADVNHPDKDRRTPVWIAACKGRVKTIRVLYNLRGNVNTPDKDGRTPVWIAACKGRVKTIRELDTLRADVNHPDKDRRTPLWVAAQNGHVDTIRVLAKLGANVNTSDNNGETPVYIAAQNGYEGAIRELVKLGANVNTLDNDRTSPMSVAACNGHLRIIRFLGELGADVKTHDENGHPLSLIVSAIGNGNTDTIRVLFELGADIDEAIESTTVQEAVFWSKGDSLRVLLELGAWMGGPNEIWSILENSSRDFDSLDTLVMIHLIEHGWIEIINDQYRIKNEAEFEPDHEDYFSRAIQAYNDDPKFKYEIDQIMIKRPINQIVSAIRKGSPIQKIDGDTYSTEESWWDKLTATAKEKDILNRLWELIIVNNGLVFKKIADYLHVVAHEREVCEPPRKRQKISQTSSQPDSPSMSSANTLVKKGFGPISLSTDNFYHHNKGKFSGRMPFDVVFGFLNQREAYMLSSLNKKTFGESTVKMMKNPFTLEELKTAFDRLAKAKESSAST